MSSSLNKIHVSNSTGLSLNERFTAITSQPKMRITNVKGVQNRSRSRSRSVQRNIPVTAEHVSSRANHRLLAQLQRKHKMQTALKLKRRSMRTVGGATARISGSNIRIPRGSVKAFRVGANGKPIKTNSLSNIATMKADREILRKQRKPLRRANSSANLSNRLGPRRPAVGGAAQRVAKRSLERQHVGAAGGRRNSGPAGGGGRMLTRDGVNGRSGAANINGRSRSRSRTRTQQPVYSGPNRSRSRNPDFQQNVNVRGRSRSRNRNDANVNRNNNRRGRSLSRGRGGVNKSALPIKARLGLRPGANNVHTAGQRGVAQNNRRNASQTRRGVQSGRVQKRRNTTNQNVARSASVGDNNGRNRVRSRSAVRNANVGGGVQPRSRSRTRKGQVGQQRQQQGGVQARQARQQPQQQRNSRAPRGRSQQRRGGNNNVRNGAASGPKNNGNAQTQQRRGRSRSGRGAIGGQRNQGIKPTTTTVNKDELDKELDQYMATTKTENDMDYLLKN